MFICFIINVRVSVFPAKLPTKQKITYFYSSVLSYIVENKNVAKVNGKNKNITISV